MLYTSTRDKSVKVTSAEAIAHGISKEGGLFVPAELPKITPEFIASTELKDSFNKLYYFTNLEYY